MTKELHEYCGKTFSDLRFDRGELIGLDSPWDPEGSYPFVLGTVHKFEMGHKENGFKIVYYPKKENPEHWTLFPGMQLFKLWAPERIYKGLVIPKIEPIKVSNCNSGVYIDRVHLGEDNIRKALASDRNKREGLDFYLNMFK